MMEGASFAPGIFRMNGQGAGQGVILDSSPGLPGRLLRAGGRASRQAITRSGRPSVGNPLIDFPIFC
jgi:hypothetical protein